MATPSAFKKLSAAETTKLLGQLHEVRGTVLFKFPDTGVYRLKTSDKGWGQNILAARPANLGDDRRDKIVTGNFLVAGQIYFFNAKVRIQKKQIHLALTGDLHKLARRKQDRFPVPESLPLHLLTKRVGDKILFVRGVLQDLSIKGARVALNTSQNVVKVGDPITGILRFASRKPIVVSGVIRHHKRVTKGRFDQIFGLEFSKVEDLVRLQGWLVDLQREMFMKR